MAYVKIENAVNITPVATDMLPASQVGSVIAQQVTVGQIAAFTNGAAVVAETEKTTPVDADLVNLVDSAASNSPKKLSWASIKMAIATYYNSLVATLTNKTLNLTNNTVTGTTEQFNTALSDNDFATLAGAETLTGKTLTSPKINEDVAVTATSTEINVLDGIPATLTATELGYVDGVTSAIQTQLNGKSPIAGPGSSQAFATGALTQTGTALLAQTTGVVGVGTATPFSDAAQFRGIDIESGQSVVPTVRLHNKWIANSNAIVRLDKSRNGGTIVTGDYLGSMEFYGHDGTAMVRSCDISAISTGTISTGVVPSHLAVRTINLAGAIAERIRLTSEGNVNIGSPAGDGTSKLHVTGAISATTTVTATQHNVSAMATAPVSATATGTLGEVRVTAGYIYVCTATNTWVRAALSTWP